MGGELVGEETAKATQEVAKAAGKGIDLVEKLGDSRVGQVISGVVAESLGLLEDWFHHARIRNLVRLEQRTREILEERGVEPLLIDQVSPVLLLPIVKAAADEGRSELQDMFASLLAAAMDPARVDEVRQSFVEAVKRMDPLDARILQDADDSLSGGHDMRGQLALGFGVSEDQIEVSFENLFALGLTEFSGSGRRTVHFTAKGRELMRVASD
jgi:hypothetical protein